MVKPRPLIGLYAQKPQSGKSSVAAVLQRQGYLLLPMAGTLKRMLRVLLVDLGMSEEEIRWAMDRGKEINCVPGVPGCTPRQMLQSLGTEWGRRLVDQELWVRCWAQLAGDAMARGRGVVVDDVRFWNEAQLVQHLGGVMVEVKRPGGGSDAFIGHASEGGLAEWAFDACLSNDQDLAHLEVLVDQLLVTMKERTDADD
ncbi:MAG: hypothetical protein LW834_08115 [Cyanobium sp. 49614_E6]|jgi:hypothetical protein|nr:hypothetical protein [Cyanobium sp. 49614_E6]